MKILSWFPKSNNLTELTLLSKFELICYLFFFLVICYIYFSCSQIPVKDIYIEIDRVDSIGKKNFFKEENYWYSDSLALDSIYANYAYVQLVFQLSEIFESNTRHMWMSALGDQWIKPRFHKMTKENIEYQKFRGTTRDFGYLDSLRSFYRDSLKLSYSDPMFYFKVNTTHKDMSSLLFNSKTQDEGDSTSHWHSELNYGFNKRTQTINVFGAGFDQYSKYCILDKPSIFNLSDISQCYYRIHIQSHLVNYIFLNMYVYGANDIAFLNNKPDTICNEQNYQYFFENHIQAYGVNEDIKLHVYSKELAGKQATRMFFLTSLLSAMITIFLTFLIIYIYRKFVYKIHMEFINKRNTNILNQNNQRRIRNKKYKSRKNKSI